MNLTLPFSLSFIHSCPQMYMTSHEFWPSTPRIWNEWLVIDVCASSDCWSSLSRLSGFILSISSHAFNSLPPAASFLMKIYFTLSLFTSRQVSTFGRIEQKKGWSSKIRTLDLWVSRRLLTPRPQCLGPCEYLNNIIVWCLDGSNMSDLWMVRFGHRLPDFCFEYST